MILYSAKVVWWNGKFRVAQVLSRTTVDIDNKATFLILCVKKNQYVDED